MTDKTIAIEVLNGAIKVLEDNKWTRNEMARDCNSNPVILRHG